MESANPPSKKLPHSCKDYLRSTPFSFAGSDGARICRGGSFTNASRSNKVTARARFRGQGLDLQCTLLLFDFRLTFGFFRQTVPRQQLDEYPPPRPTSSSAYRRSLANSNAPPTVLEVHSFSSSGASSVAASDDKGDETALLRDFLDNAGAFSSCSPSLTEELDRLLSVVLTFSYRPAVHQAPEEPNCKGEGKRGK